MENLITNKGNVQTIHVPHTLTQTFLYIQPSQKNLLLHTTVNFDETQGHSNGSKLLRLHLTKSTYIHLTKSTCIYLEGGGGRVGVKKRHIS